MTYSMIIQLIWVLMINVLDQMNITKVLYVSSEYHNLRSSLIWKKLSEKLLFIQN